MDRRNTYNSKQQTKMVEETITKQPPDPILKNEDLNTFLNQLHGKYIFAPDDKADKNVIIIICKQFYMSVIVRELSLGLLDSDMLYYLCKN